MRLPHAHQAGQRDWYPVVLLIAIIIVLLLVVLMPPQYLSGLPS